MIRKKNRLNLYKNSCRQQNIRRSFIWNFERDFKILLCDRFQNHRFVWRNCGIESRSNIVLEIMINCRRDKELITQQKPGNLLIRKPQNIKLTKLQQFFLMIFWFADKELLEFPIPLHTAHVCIYCPQLYSFFITSQMTARDVESRFIEISHSYQRFDFISFKPQLLAAGKWSCWHFALNKYAHARAIWRKRKIFV